MKSQILQVVAGVIITCTVAAAQLIGLEPEAKSAEAPRRLPRAVLADLHELHQEVVRRRAGVTWTTEPGALPTPSRDLAETYLAYAALQLAKAHDYVDTITPDTARADLCLRSARRALAVTAPKQSVSMTRYGSLVEHAYFARNDQSPQPYFVYRPPDLPVDKPVPLVIFLHGYVPGTARTDPYLVSDFVLRLADRAKCILVIPHGRTNTDFQYAGEVDVMRVKAEMLAFYPVDPDRVYLLGVSMGGAGAWQVACHYPDHFAATAPINGQADWFRFWHQHFGYPAREELPDHLNYLIALNNPLDLASNLKNLYSYSQQALTCFVGIEHTRAMVRQLKATGAPFETFEDPSDMGHYIYWQPDCWERAFEHLADKQRFATPASVQFKTYSLRFPGTNGFEIRRLQQWGKAGVFRARMGENGQLLLNTTNVAEMWLEPPADWLGENEEVRIAWNGKKPAQIVREGPRRFRVLAPGEEPHVKGLAKTRAVCGPVADVFNFPFIAVVGTAGTEAERAAAQALAERFAADWYAYAEGSVQQVRDTEVTEEMIRDCGLVLFGLPETNTVTKRIAAQLPFALSREEIKLPDGKTYPTRDCGLLLTYPNPLNPKRYVLVVNGIHWGEGRSSNHKFDRIPDFTIFTADLVPGININQYLAAGLFDSQWRYSPELTAFGPPPEEAVGE